MASKLCDSCKSATATLFCRADSAFLCVGCDSKIHAANKLASRHARVWVCEVCEQAPAHVTCKADAAALCVTCDRDIHSANLLASRHDRVPVTPFYESILNSPNSVPAVKSNGAVNFLETDRYFSDADTDGEVSREEAEAASWLLPNPKAVEDSPDLNSDQYVNPEMDPYLDLEYGAVDPKFEPQEQNSSGTDGVVPGQSNSVQAPMVSEHGFDMDFSSVKPFPHTYTSQCLSQSVSSSSLDVGVVPDGRSVSSGVESTNPVQLSSADREARVLRYREKRKNRKFEKTIRYASRKAYAETRPRIKGRFAKRTDAGVDVEAERIFGYGVVPSF